MAKYYEIVIFTAALKDYADSAIALFDKDGKYIKHRLYRCHTRPKGLAYIKDLSLLGRELKRTIIIDNVAMNFQMQPQNGICIKAWLGSKADNELLLLIPFLKDIVEKKVEDVKVALKDYRQKIRGVKINVKGGMRDRAKHNVTPLK